jgi:hypothetical protein
VYKDFVKTMMSIVTSFSIQDLFICTDVCLGFVILLGLDQLILVRFTRFSSLVALDAMCTGILLVGAACSTWNDTEHEWDSDENANYQCGSNLGLSGEEDNSDFFSCLWIN